MRLWVDWTRVWKRGAPAAGLEFFTYSELIWWFISSMLMNPARWRWFLFVLCGWRFGLPNSSQVGHFVKRETYNFKQYV